MPYSFTSPDDLPLAPPRYPTIPELWHEIKAKANGQSRPQKAKAATAAAAITVGELRLFVGHIAHHLTPIPGAIDVLRSAIDSIWTVLFPSIPPAPDAAPT